MAGTDKTTRILILYTQLIEGKRIYKQSFCMDMDIDRRTFDRDIEDIRLFLSETFYAQELVYDRSDESYHFKNIHKHQELSGMEFTYILECIREAGGLRRDEYIELLNNLIRASDYKKRVLFTDMTQRYADIYQSCEKDAILKMQWDLQQCITELDVISLNLINGNKKGICPVGLRIFNREFYLFAYDEEEIVHTYLVDDIVSFVLEHRKFENNLIEKFDMMNWERLEDLIKKVGK